MSKLLDRVRYSRLSVRLLAVIVLFGVLLTMVSTAVQLMVEYNRNVGAIRTRLANVERSYAASLTNSLWSFDERQLQVLLGGISQLPDIRFVEVATNYGERYAVGTPPDDPDALTRTFELTQVEEGRVVPLGTVTVAATLEGVRQATRERALFILGIEAITTFIIALLFLYLFQQMVTRHLGSMAAYARSMRLDRLDEPLRLDRRRKRLLGPDELDQVAHAINQMRRSLQAEIAERRRSAANSRFLAEAGEELGQSLEFTEVADRLTELSAGALADIAICFAAQQDGPMTPVSVAGPHVLRRHARALDVSSLVPQRGAVVYEQLPPQLREQPPIRELRVQSAASVPLDARRKRLGFLLLLSIEGAGHPLRSDDAPLLDELGRRASMALENALLYREAQDAIRLRDEFLNVASHELKTPLTSLRLHTGALERLSRAPVSDEALRHAIRKAGAVQNRQVERLKHLVESLVDVSQILAERLELRREYVDLEGLVRDVLDRSSIPLSSSGCAVQLHVDGPAVGRWDPVRLRQVVLGLLNNAMKFGAGKPIEIRISSSDGLARLSVTDHGIGISREDQARIFERFARAVSERHFGGLGLGLYVARKIVEAHGGRIQVESAPGQGATFSVELPATPAVSRVAERPSPGEFLH